MTTTALAFDTLNFANELKQAGVPERQAEIHVRTIANLISERLATKEDLKALESTVATMATKEDFKALERDFKELENSTKHEIKSLEVNTKRDLKELEYRMVIKLGSFLGGLLVAGISVLAVLIKVPL